MTPTIKIEKSVLDIFNRDVQRLMRSRKTTPSQLGAAKLYAKLNGFVDSTDDDSKPEEKVIADQVIERDGRRLRTVVTDVTEKP